MEEEEIKEIPAAKEITAQDIFDRLKTMDSEDIKHVFDIVTYFKDINKLRGLILSMIIPHDIEYDKDQPEFLIRVQNGQNNYMDIGFNKNRRKEWSRILIDIANYYSIDLSDIIDESGSFRIINFPDKGIAKIDGVYCDIDTREPLSEEELARRNSKTESNEEAVQDE